MSSFTSTTTASDPSTSLQPTPGASADFLDLFLIYYSPIHGPLTITICAFGSIANTINILVLTQREMIGPTNLLLTGLSLAQLGLVGDYLLFLSYDLLATKCIPGWHSFELTFCKLININMNIVFHTIALTHTLLLAVFRFIAVRLPTKARSIVNMRYARLSVTSIYLAVPVICLPVFFSTVIKSTEEYYDDGNTTTICNYSGSHDPEFELFFADEEILTKIPIWMFGTVFKLLPCVIISVLTYMLAGSLKQVERRQQALLGNPSSSTQADLKENRKRNQRNRITRMLMIIVMLFVAVEMPQGILCFMVGILGNSFAIGVYNNLGEFFEMLTILYSSINFILYCSMSTQFQTSFKALVCSSCQRLSRKQEYIPVAGADMDGIEDGKNSASIQLRKGKLSKQCGPTNV